MHRPTDSSDPSEHTDRLFRIWILHCEPWEPQHTCDVPIKAIALEPAEPDCFSAVEARDYVEGFNTSPERPPTLWAIQVPVRMRLDRDMAPGARIQPKSERPPLAAGGPRNCAR